MSDQHKKLLEGHTTEDEAAESFLREFDAALGGKWLAAVFRIVDGKVKLFRTTHEFPRGDFDNCVKILSADLKQEAGLLDTSPLPFADLSSLADQ